MKKRIDIKFFANKENEIFLIDFVNTLLKIEIIKIEIKDKKDFDFFGISNKGEIIQLEATLNDGNIANIIIQIRNKNGFELKIMFSSIKNGMKEQEKVEYKNLITVYIVDYILFEDYSDYVSKSKVALEKFRECNVVSTIEWCFIELPKFRKHQPNMNEKINQWLVFLDNEDEELIRIAESKNEIIKKAIIEIEKANY